MDDYIFVCKTLASKQISKKCYKNKLDFRCSDPLK